MLTRRINPLTVLIVLGYTLFCCKARRKRLEHERSVGKITIMFLPTSWVEFSRSGQIFRRTANKICPKKRQNRLNEQNRDKLVNRCCISHDKRVEWQKFSLAARGYIIAEGFWNWKLEVESLGNYAGWSYEQIRRWRKLTALKFLMQMQQTKQNFVFWFCRDNSSFVRQCREALWLKLSKVSNHECSQSTIVYKLK